MRTDASLIQSSLRAIEESAKRFAEQGTDQNRVRIDPAERRMLAEIESLFPEIEEYDTE